MAKKLSILTLLAFAAAIVAAAPAHADGMHVHADGDLDEGSSDADRTPDHRQVFHAGDNFVLNLDKSSVFDWDGSDDKDSGYKSEKNTAEWVWWLKDKDKNKFGNDQDPINAPEPASLFLLGSGVLALAAWRRRTNHSTPVA